MARIGYPVTGKENPMRIKFLASAVGVVVLLALSTAASGCGGNDDTSSSAESESSEAAETAATDTTAPPGAATVTVKMDEYDFIPQDATAKAGQTTLEAVNVGEIPHELVLAKSNLEPAKLPTTSNGEVDEEALDTVGEAPDVAAGDTGSFAANLEPGSYVMICNLPGHYSSGMYGSLTVK
jgi:uncharacterized cupredoxin-like copper-binding protein